MKYLSVIQKDGSLWGVPVDAIALDRATHYANEFDGNVQRSLNEDTLPLFAAEPYEIQDWAVNQMNWSDFGEKAIKLKDAPALTKDDFQYAWMENDKKFVEHDPGNASGERSK